MNKLFKDIRHSDVDAVRVAISKNITVVNEVYTAKAPKKDIGQSPLQVAIKCGEFEIIELLLENGADPDFMENPELVPPHSVCMSVLHDAIIGVFSSLCYEQYISSEKYVNNGIGGFDPAVELAFLGAYAFLLHCPDGCALMDGGKKLHALTLIASVVDTNVKPLFRKLAIA